MPLVPSEASVASPIEAYLAALHRRFEPLDEGSVASYIPELAKVDANSFGIALATVDGQVYEVGTTRLGFTIQSISKPLVYGVALEDRGRERVLQAIGVEPTGDAFNSISLEPQTGRPLNPMINAGAIATSSLVGGTTLQARLARVLDALSTYAGRELSVDEGVFESERATGHRNRAIGHMLRNYDIIDDDPEPALELYFKQCSIVADCRDLALIGATLANGGVNPVTRKRAVRSEFIDSILSVMTTCGMYDFSGEWVYRVGMPAKSGVGGGIVAVLPGQLGIGVFSPRLDARGNSVRGVKVCEALSTELGLHFLQPPRPSAGTVRSRYSLASVRSKRRRSPEENRLLDEAGRRAVVYELQGDLRFATVEPVARDIVASGAGWSMVVLDFKRVTHADEAATRMLAGLVSTCAARRQQLVLTRVRRGELDGLGSDIDPRHARALVFQPLLDIGLEWCERQLLAGHSTARPATAIEGLAQHRWCDGATAEDLADLRSRLIHRAFDPGAMIVRRGEPADALYFIVRGEVSVTIDLPTGGQKRLSTMAAGSGFGEPALIEGGVRSADVRADTDVECFVLPAGTFAQMARDRPTLALRLLHNLLCSSTETAARLTVEAAALEG
jgi:glutaminase